MVYGTRNDRERSGAYLFLPGGAAQPLPKETPLVRVQRGPIVSVVTVFIRHVQHVVSLCNSPGEYVVLIYETQRRQYEGHNTPLGYP